MTDFGIDDSSKNSHFFLNEQKSDKLLLDAFKIHILIPYINQK